MVCASPKEVAPLLFEGRTAITTTVVVVEVLEHLAACKKLTRFSFELTACQAVNACPTKV